MEESNFNYNRLLEIYAQDVEKEEDLSKLIEWENVLMKKNQEMKTRINNKRILLNSAYNVKTKNELQIMEDLQSNIKFFQRSIHNRIKRIKSLKDFNRNIYFNMLKFFKKIVKEKLPEEEYAVIRAEAFRRAEELSEQEMKKE